MFTPSFTDKQKIHGLDGKAEDDGQLYLQLWSHWHIFEQANDKPLECPAGVQSGLKTWLTVVEHNRNVILIWAEGTAG